jgi:hypothetical protein
VVKIGSKIIISLPRSKFIKLNVFAFSFRYDEFRRLITIYYEGIGIGGGVGTKLFIVLPLNRKLSIKCNFVMRCGKLRVPKIIWLFRFPTQTHTHSLSLSQMHTHSFLLHSNFHTLSFSVSASHKHTHTNKHILSFSYIPICSYT